MQFIQHYCVQEIYFASVSNIDSAAAGTRNIHRRGSFHLMASQATKHYRLCANNSLTFDEHICTFLTQELAVYLAKEESQ